MAPPLSPLQDSSLNTTTAPTMQTNDSYQSHSYDGQLPEEHQHQYQHHEHHPAASSPWVSGVAEPNMDADQKENVSPPKSRHSRILTGAELSPLKILSARSPEKKFDDYAPASSSPLIKSPRKMSPEKRFPIKVSNPLSETSPAQSREQTPPQPSAQPQVQSTTPPTHSRSPSLDGTMKDGEKSKQAIGIFEDEPSAPVSDDDSLTEVMEVDQVEDEVAGPDDTMVSTFSTFSAVPSMTMFANIGQSPTKSALGGMTPKAKGRYEASSSHTPRQRNRRESENTTSLLMDFTDSARFPGRSPAKRGGNLTSSRTMPNVNATPTRGYTDNLIDFDIPPMPTPRSMPSITPRELESLKSKFLSEISSLKASLSGKEAEVQSLKSAVNDAEKRVGESLEQLREEQISKDEMAAEKDDWERRGREMESVLRKVREEIVTSHRERDEMEQKLDESEKRREAAEMLHQEAESKMAGMRAGRDSDKTDSPEKPKNTEASNREVEVAVERVARELHGLYKSKHETKVAALKKSYESRWQKKIDVLEAKIADLNEDNDRLRAGADTTIARFDQSTFDVEERKAKSVKDSTTIKELTADVQRLEAVLGTVKKDNHDLRAMLEQERVERSELVQLAEEMMSMQSFVGPSSEQHEQQQQHHHHEQQQQQRQQQQQQIPAPHTQRTPAPQRQMQYADRGEPAMKTPKISAEGFRSSIGRSGLKAPGTGLRAPHERNKSAGGGLPRPGGGAGRSGIMSSIEKMGNYRGRGTE